MYISLDVCRIEDPTHREVIFCQGVWYCEWEKSFVIESTVDSFYHLATREEYEDFAAMLNREVQNKPKTVNFEGKTFVCHPDYQGYGKVEPIEFRALLDEVRNGDKL